MVGIDVQIGESQRLVAWFVTATVRLDGDKNGINLRQRFGIIKPQYPSLLGGVVDVKDA